MALNRRLPAFKAQAPAIRVLSPLLVVVVAGAAAIVALFAVVERVGLPATSLAIVLFAALLGMTPLIAWRSRTLDPEAFLVDDGRPGHLEQVLLRAMPLFVMLPLPVLAEGLMTAAPAALALAFGALAGFLLALARGGLQIGREALRPPARAAAPVAVLLVAVALLLAMSHLRSIATLAPNVFLVRTDIAVPLVLGVAALALLLAGRRGAARLEPALLLLAVLLAAGPALLLLANGRAVPGFVRLAELADWIVPGMRSAGWSAHAGAGLFNHLALGLTALCGVAGAMLAVPGRGTPRDPDLETARFLAWPGALGFLVIAALCVSAGAVLLALRGLPGLAIDAAGWPLALVQFGALRVCGAMPQSLDTLLAACGGRNMLGAADIALARPLAPFASPVLLGWPVVTGAAAALGAVALSLAALIRLILRMATAIGRDLYAGLAEPRAPRVRIVAIVRLSVVVLSAVLFFAERIAISAADLTILALALSTATLAPAALADAAFPGNARAKLAAIAAGGAAFLVLFAFHVADPLGLVRMTGMGQGFVAPVLAPLLAGLIGAGAALATGAGGGFKLGSRAAR